VRSRISLGNATTTSTTRIQREIPDRDGKGDMRKIVIRAQAIKILPFGIQILLLHSNLFWN